MRAIGLALAGLLVMGPARADVITDLIRKSQIERFTSKEQAYDPVPVIVPNHFRSEAAMSDTVPGYEVADCHRHAWRDRRTEFSDLYLADSYDPGLRRLAEAQCMARKRLRILHR
jgi:hypothetical protein